ncbi:anthranilate phosphoribosyltransferase [Sorangium sp. So ce341]|uniref:anthranilate phosphoribosyltransferase n=1 Tax=Sorangium sp. So ce341 TaxID=3133302 RepID=UPI003F5F4802
MRPVEVLTRAAAREHLLASEARDAMLALLDGAFTPAQAAAWLSLLACKGETVAELEGFFAALMARAVRVAQRADAIDTAGTGGDHHGSFNASTAAALIAAAAGAVVAKAGNRAASSRCGSADLLEAMDIDIELGPAEVDRSLAETGFAFLFSQRFHPALRGLAPLRREIGLRTALNLLGPLANPAAPARRVLGVAKPALVDLYLEILPAIGARRALIVHARDGLDELSLAAPTDIVELRDGALRRFTVTPEDLGVARCDLAALRGAGPAENAALLRALCRGERGPLHDFCAANAAAALYLAGLASDLRDGVEVARRAIRSGALASLVDNLIARSAKRRSAEGLR